MTARILVVAAFVGIAAFALWHRAPRAAIVALSPSAEPKAEVTQHRRRSPLVAAATGLVVYVAGAVRHPGLYRVREGDRYARAVALAGGFGSGADATGVNLAQRAADGDEVLVPRIGETVHRRNGHGWSSHRASGRHRRSPSAPGEDSVDINNAPPEELARVPGVGRAIAARIVALRDREGAFGSLDELLDVAGMTQSRLARARPYLQELGGAEGSPH